MVDCRVKDANCQENSVKIFGIVVAAGVNVYGVYVDEHHNYVEDLHQATNLVEGETILLPFKVEQLTNGVGCKYGQLLRLIQQLHEPDVGISILNLSRRILFHVEAHLRKKVDAIPDLVNFTAVDFVILG